MNAGLLGHAVKARVYAGPRHLWILHVPGVAWGARRTWRAAYDDADLLARTLGARPDRRIPGTTLTCTSRYITPDGDVKHCAQHVGHPGPHTTFDPQARPAPAGAYQWRQLDADLGDDWPTADRRIPPDECEACLTHSDDPPAEERQ